jgi:hypothetical protein
LVSIFLHKNQRFDSNFPDLGDYVSNIALEALGLVKAVSMKNRGII